MAKRKPHVFRMPSHFMAQAAQRAERASRLVGAIPPGELPDASDRDALIQAIVDGDVAEVYYGASGRSYATLPGLDAAGVSERVALTDWIALSRDGLSADDIRAVLIERDRAREGGKA